MTQTRAPSALCAFLLAGATTTVAHAQTTGPQQPAAAATLHPPVDFTVRDWTVNQNFNERASWEVTLPLRFLSSHRDSPRFSYQSSSSAYGPSAQDNQDARYNLLNRPMETGVAAYVDGENPFQPRSFNKPSMKFGLRFSYRFGGSEPAQHSTDLVVSRRSIYNFDQ